MMVRRNPPSKSAPASRKVLRSDDSIVRDSLFAVGVVIRCPLVAHSITTAGDYPTASIQVPESIGNYFATLLDQAVPIHDVAARLGHDAAVLMRRYAHAGRDSQDRAAALESLLDEPSRARLTVVPDADDAEALDGSG